LLGLHQKLEKKIMKQQIISFHYTLKDKGGQVLDNSSSGEPLSFLEGASQIIPGLEAELKKINVGDKKQVTVPAAQAYGSRDEKLIFKVERKKLPVEKLNVGDRFRGGSEAHAPVFTVTALSDAEATLDGNHPLAGEDLFFDVEIKQKRDATDEELNHGHSHGDCGCGHSH
jgi:FKBP-type peptidyl-prolyl cis-trans isomerase SlyD